jgi:hypothetical protein
MGHFNLYGIICFLLRYVSHIDSYHVTHTDDMTGFDNGILIAYGMCPPVELMLYYQMDPTTQPTHFMQGTATKVWGDDVLKIMHTTAADWDSLDNDDHP